MNFATTFVATFLAAAVEVIEMVIIVVGVGAVRGWRSTLLGAGSGFLLLAMMVAGFGAALTAVPIGVLRLVVGGLLLVFGLQWLRKGIRRVAANGFAGSSDEDVAPRADEAGMDWTAFVLAFKGVVLEGLEIAFIVVSFGATSGHIPAAVLGAAAALVALGAAGASAHRLVQRIPRSALQLIVGTMLASFGTFWATAGLGVAWPGSDTAIPALLGVYVATAAVLVSALRRGMLGAREPTTDRARESAMPDRSTHT